MVWERLFPHIFKQSVNRPQTIGIEACTNKAHLKSLPKCIIGSPTSLPEM
jgi:hypothetical protein